MINQELDQLLNTRTDFIGKIYPLYKNNVDHKIIAQKVGHKTTSNVSIFTTALDYLYGKKTMETRMYKSLEQLEYRLKEWTAQPHSKELQQHLHKLAVETKMLRGENSIFSDEELIAMTHNLKEPGVYVYTYPQYLLSEAFDEHNRTLFKIGASGNLDNRIARQARQTEVPEDLVTVRMFPTKNAFDKEEHFHNILTAAGHHHKTTSGGVEWFRTNISTIDAIAQAIGLENVEQDHVNI